MAGGCPGGVSESCQAAGRPGEARAACWEQDHLPSAKREAKEPDSHLETLPASPAGTEAVPAF